MVLSKMVEIRPSGRGIPYYKDKGYDAKWHQPLLVKIEDLSLNSCAKVDVLCDMCKEKNNYCI